MITKKDIQNGQACIFQLSNGISVEGIITACFPGEPENYYYVAKGNITSFKAYFDRKNFNEMRKLCAPISLTSITGLRKAG